MNDIRKSADEFIKSYWQSMHELSDVQSNGMRQAFFAGYAQALRWMIENRREIDQGIMEGRRRKMP